MSTNTIFNVFYFCDTHLCIKYMEYIKNTKMNYLFWGGMLL